MHSNMEQIDLPAQLPSRFDLTFAVASDDPNGKGEELAEQRLQEITSGAVKTVTMDEVREMRAQREPELEQAQPTPNLGEKKAQRKARIAARKPAKKKAKPKAKKSKGKKKAKKAKAKK